MTTDLIPFDDLKEQAKTLSLASTIPEALRKKPEDVLVILLTARELGIGGMQALRSIHVVNGKPVMSADLMVGLVMKHPACRYFRMVESTSERATYETLREGHPEPTRLTFTMDQAKTAGLTGKQVWRQFPDAMLRARCSAALARIVYPDLVVGIYDPEELEASRPAKSDVIDVHVSDGFVGSPDRLAQEIAANAKRPAPPTPRKVDFPMGPAPSMPAEEYAALPPVIQRGYDRDTVAPSQSADPGDQLPYPVGDAPNPETGEVPPIVKPTKALIEKRLRECPDDMEAFLAIAADAQQLSDRDKKALRTLAANVQERIRKALAESE